MSFALSAGVTGLQAHQRMLDVAGNNLANINTVGYKGSRIIFSELLAQILKRASQPTAAIGGINPQQIGSGVQVAGISPDMSQGNLINTNSPLDLAIDGEGYFVLSDGSRNIYTRAGAFTVDAASNLVDPATGYIVQTPDDSNIRIPYDEAMPANATSEIQVSGNLSADATLPGGKQTNMLMSDITYTAGGNNATGATTIGQLDSDFYTSGTWDSATIKVSGFEHDGTALSDAAGLAVTAATTMTEIIAHINSILQADDGTDTASFENGKIVIKAGSSGYSKSDVKLTFANGTGSADVTMPGYFEITTVGGEEVKSFNIVIYDSQGGPHVLSGAFVRNPDPAKVNLWDLILTSISGNVVAIDISGLSDRRIFDIEFNGTDGSFAGLDTGTGDTAQFKVTFGHRPDAQVITVDMGTTGQFDGLTQFARASTAVAKEQDGYATGELTSVSVSNEGVIVGAFTNGVKKNLATIQLALFKNPAGLESVGSGYFTPSVNSGEAIATQGLIGGAGTIHGGSLEKSNADIASLFVAMIEAQNGYNANARTIKVANDMLKELTNIIR